VVVTDTGSTKSIASGGTTTDHTLGLSGTAEAGSKVQIFDGSVYLGDAILNGKSWTFSTPQLADGNHDFSARIVDAAGNSTNVAGVKAHADVVADHAWSNFSGWGSIDALAAIKSIGIVSYHNDRTGQVEELSDVKAPSSTPWGIDLANINDVQSYGCNGTGVTVAVLDTGLDLKNAALNQNLSKWNWNFVNNNNDVTDVDGHGTFAASEIHAANNDVGLTGAALSSELMVLKVTDTWGQSDPARNSTAINYAIDHGAKVIYMPFAAGPVSEYSRALLNSSGVVLVTSAGLGHEKEPDPVAKYVAQLDNGITVGALGHDNTNTAPLSLDFSSNRAGDNECNYVAAAGRYVSGYGLDGKVHIQDSDGAALVASEAALIWSASPSLTAAQVVSAITDTATQHVVL
jgi:hypothetical protein